MSTLTSYSDLEDAIAAWLGQTNFASSRSDLQSNIPIFITLFEAAANRRLRVQKMEVKTTLTTSSGSVALPTDYLDYRRLTWKGSRNQIVQYVEPEAIQFLFPTNPKDTPEYFTIEAGNIITSPIDDTASIYELVYFQTIPALSAGSNWLFSAYPDAYLFGSLCEAKAYTEDQNNIVIWKGRRDEVLDEIQKLSDLSRGAGVMQTTGPTP